MPKIIKETELPECGLMQIEGECYQDVLAILSRNGYTVEMTTEPCDIPCEAKHIIRYWKVVKADEGRN